MARRGLKENWRASGQVMVSGPPDFQLTGIFRTRYLNMDGVERHPEAVDRGLFFS